jgi:branched-chain amino acid transport system substrate-binding protein
MRKVCVSLVILVGLTLAFNQVQAAPPVRLGFNDVRSGPHKSAGDQFLMGVQLAVNIINKTGGLLGRRVEIIVEDTQLKPEIAVQKLKKMVLRDKCDVIFAGSGSNVILAISQAMPRYKKPFIVFGGFAMAVTGENFNPYVFRTCSNAATATKALALYCGKQSKFKKVYLLNQDYSYGHDIANFYERFIKEIAPDTEIVGKDFHPIFNKDFAPYISKVMASGADYLVTGNWGTDEMQLMIQGRSLGLNIPIAAIFMGDINTLTAMPGDQAVGNIGVDCFVLGLNTPEARKFEDLFYDNSGGSWPTTLTVMGYNGAMLYGEAVKKAGSLDVHKFIKAFEGLKWNAPTGTVTMRAKDHQLMHPICVGKVIKKTKYFDFPYMKPIQVFTPEQLTYKPEEFGWRPYKGTYD